jgi:hypothetical protein
MGELREDNTDVTLKCRHVSSQLVNGVFDHPSSNAGKLFIKQELHKAWCAGPFSARGPNPMLQDDRELCEVGGASLSLSVLCSCALVTLCLLTLPPLGVKVPDGDARQTDQFCAAAWRL